MRYVCYMGCLTQYKLSNIIESGKRFCILCTTIIMHVHRTAHTHKHKHIVPFRCSPLFKCTHAVQMKARCVLMPSFLPFTIFTIHLYKQLFPHVLVYFYLFGSFWIDPLLFLHSIGPKLLFLLLRLLLLLPLKLPMAY